MTSKGWRIGMVAAALATACLFGAQAAGAAADPRGAGAGSGQASGPGWSDRAGGAHGGWGMGMGQGGMMAALNLTRDQKERLADIHDRQAREGIRMRADLAVARLDLRKLLRADPPSQSAIDAQIDRIARTRAELAKARVASLLEMRSVLTPEQREIVRDHMGMGMGMGMGMHGRGMGRGFGRGMRPGMGPGGHGPANQQGGETGPDGDSE